MEKKCSSKYFKAILSLVIAFALLLSVTATTYGWIAVKNDINVSFNAGGGAEIVLYYATFDKVKNDYVWSEGNNLDSDKTFGNKFETKDSPLHLGQIQNLLFREIENVSWFALKIKTNGNRYFNNLRMSFDTDKPMTLYENIETIPKEIIEPSIQVAINNYVEKLIKVDNFNVTDMEPEKFKTDVMSKVDVRTDNADALSVACYVPLDKDLIPEEISYHNKYEKTSEFYYVYFRVLPVLKTYGDFADYIANYLPCVMTFNIQINITTQSVESVTNPTGK